MAHMKIKWLPRRQEPPRARPGPGKLVNGLLEVSEHNLNFCCLSVVLITS